jgi:hypothetical protein
LREVTGYPAAYDWTGSAKAPENDGIFIVNVHTGEKRLLVSFRALADAVRPVRPNVDQAALYTNHTLWNRNDDRIYFFLRGRYRSQPMWINVPCTIRPDGSELVAHELYIGGHPEWADGNRVIGALDGRQILYDVDAKQVVGQIGTTEILPMPKSDCSLSPGGDWFVSGYTSGRENQYVFLRQSDGARVRSGAFSRGPYTRGSLRIDPAPRWNRTNDAVLVSTWTREEQTRQLFTVRIHEGTSEQTETLLENRPDRSRKIIVAGIMGQPIRKGNYKERNYQETESLIREAAQAGAQLVCTFEQFLDGYGFDANKIESMEDERIARYEVLGESECVGRLGDLARELDIVIVAGVGIREASRTYNSALIFDRSGRLTGIYRKTHNRNRYATWFAPLSNAEKKARCPSFDIGSGRIGVKICNDRHFRETTAYMIEDGCELLLCPSYGRYDPSRLKEDTAEFGVWAVFVHPRGCQFIDRGKIVYEQPAVNGKGSIAVHEVEFRTPDTTGLEMQNPTTQLPNGGSDP